ncbi:MAG TPA: two-component regulator propeller domain-containing protein, partial [Bacteroidales bacterium]|nr:two-component regulator propeller domain-containing protein [Bacteroidales bacterium]
MKKITMGKTIMKCVIGYGKMNIIVSYLLLIIICQFQEKKVYAVESHYYYMDVISKEHALSHSVVRVIEKDSEGFFWFGTDKGLNRYDAYTCLDLSIYGQKTDEYNDKIIHAIYEDNSRNLWIGTSSNEVLRIQIPTMHMKSYAIEDHEIVKYDEEVAVYDIIQDNEGIVWFASNKGLHYLDKETDSLRIFQHPTINKNLFINDLSIDKYNSLWVGTRGNGVFRINKGQIRNYLSNIKNPYIYAVIPRQDSVVYAASHGDGLFLIDIKNDVVKNYPVMGMQADALPNLINCMIPWGEERLLIGTYDGIVLFDEHDQTFTKFMSDLALPGYPQNIPVHSLNLDNQNMLWAGTRGFGVYKYYLKNDGFRHFLPVKNDYNNAANKIHAVHPVKDALYLGTENGLFEYRGKDTIVHFYHPTNSMDSTVLITSVSSLNNDTLLIGTWGSGLWLFSSLTKKFHRPACSFQLDTLKRIYDVYCDDTDIWIGSHNAGVLNLDLSFNRKEYIPSLINQSHNEVNSVRKIIKDHKGKIWMGLLSGGIAVYDQETDTFINYINVENLVNELTNNDILCLFQDSHR